MSGVIGFIWGVFSSSAQPGQAPVSGTPVLHDEQGDQQTKEQYDQSLSDISKSLLPARATKGPSTQSPGRPELLRRAEQASATEGTLHPRLRSSLNNLSISPLDYKAWKYEQKQAIIGFAEERHGKGPHSSDKSSLQQTSQESTQESSLHEASQDASQESKEEDCDRFETQAPESQASHQSSSVSLSPSPRRKRNRLVPRATDATHEMSAVSGVDLTTRRLSLKLLRVKVVHPLRLTRRPILPAMAPLSYARNAKAFQQRMKHPLFLTPMSDTAINDGPMASIYKTVLNMRVVLLEQRSQRDLRTLANPNQTALRTEIEIFFYDRWAENVSMAISTSPREDGHDILVSLDDIPAKCIYPYEPSSARSWMDRSLSDYCVCIGGPSKLLIAGARLAHEDDTMAVELLAYDRQERRYRQSLWTHRPDYERTNLEEAYKSWDTAEEATVAASKQQKSPVVSTATASDETKSTPVATLRDNDKRQSQPAGVAVAKSSLPAAHTTDQWNRRPRVATAKRKKEKSAEISHQREAENEAPPKRPRAAQLEHTLGEAKTLWESAGRGKRYHTVCVSGVVNAFGCSSKTRRGQWKMSFSIFDDSTETPTTVIWFAHQRQKLPEFHAAGDVVALRNVQLNWWEGSMQLASNYRSGSTVSVARKTDSGTWVFGSPTTTRREPMSSDRLKELWEWGQKRLASRSTIKEDARFVIGDLIGRNSSAMACDDLNSDPNAMLQNRDATLLVSGLFGAPKSSATVHDGQPFGYLRVWDGTGPSRSDALPLPTPEANAAVANGEPHPSTMAQLARVIQAMNEDEDESNDGQPMLTPTQCCGRVTNVVVWEEAHWDLIKRCVRRGSFVRLRNVFETDVDTGASRLRCISVGAKSMITPVPPTIFEVKELLKAHNLRLNKKDPIYNPQSGILALTWSTEGNGVESRRGSHCDNTIIANPVSPAKIPGDRVAAGAPTTCQNSDVSRRKSLGRGSVVGADLDDSDGHVNSFLLTAAVTDSRLIDCIEEEGVYVVRFRVVELVQSVSEDGPNVLRPLIAETQRGRKFRFAARIRDKAGDELNVMINDPTGEMIFGVSADEALRMSAQDAQFEMQFALRASSWWRGQICSHDLHGERAFIVTDAMITAGDL